MSLPKIEYPTYTVILPVSKKEVKFRPFTMKEQKILLISTDGAEPKSIFDSICEIINVCTFGDITASDLCQTDLEILFLNIRARSSGEILTPNFKCEAVITKTDETGKEYQTKCTGIVPMEINLLDINIGTVASDKIPDDIKKGIIKVTDDIIIKMKPTSAKILLDYNKDNEFEFLMLLKNSISGVFDSTGKVYDDFTDEELSEWIELLSTGVVNKMLQYIGSIPKINHTIKGKCLICKKEHTYTINNFYDFFLF